MPCFDPGYAEYDLINSLKELDRLTDMLCTTLNHLKQNQHDLRLEIYNGLPLEVRSWHKAHRVIDIQTKEIELREIKSKQNALEQASNKLLQEIEDIKNE